MRRIVPFLLPLLALLPQPAAGQAIAYDFGFAEDEAVGAADIEADDPARPAGASVAEEDDHGADSEAGTRWLPPRAPAAAPSPARPATLSYGPFRVIDASHAAMNGISDGATPDAFAAMLRDHPGIATLELVDCPGTEDDRANLRLGRMIRAHGIATHVPPGGWVASGAVELFLAGVARSAAASARFAVHSWEDDTGRGPGDYAVDAPKNRAYLDYYRAMGMSEEEARAFYAMTNSTPFARARTLTTAEMAQWTAMGRPVPQATLARAEPVLDLRFAAAF